MNSYIERPGPLGSPRKAARLLHCGVVWVFLATVLCTNLSYAEPGDPGRPKYPDLGKVYRNVVEGEVISISGPEQRPTIYMRPVPGRDWSNILFPHRRAELAIRYVDKSIEEYRLAAGDTISVLSQLDNTSRWKTPSGKDRRTTINDVPIFDMELGQSGVFLLKHIEEEWHVVGHDKPKLYTQEPLVFEGSATDKLLHPDRGER